MPTNPFEPPKEQDEGAALPWSPLAITLAILVIGTGAWGLAVLALGAIFVALGFFQEPPQS